MLGRLGERGRVRLAEALERRVLHAAGRRRRVLPLARRRRLGDLRLIIIVVENIENGSLMDKIYSTYRSSSKYPVKTWKRSISFALIIPPLSKIFVYFQLQHLEKTRSPFIPKNQIFLR